MQPRALCTTQPSSHENSVEELQGYVLRYKPCISLPVKSLSLQVVPCFRIEQIIIREPYMNASL